MKRNTTLTWSWLNILTMKRHEALKEKFGDLDEALEHIDRDFLKELGCHGDTIEWSLQRLKEFNSESYEKEITKLGLKLITIEDDDYPNLLKQIPDAPVFLYYKGSLGILNNPCIACVGTREMSGYGKRAVEEFIPVFARSGMTTISGLAMGIDAKVARETLLQRGNTVAVLGHGLKEIYPSCNRRLADEIVESGGLVLSEFPLDQAPEKFTFPARNRIIAGLSLGTIVFEAGKGSGALITSDLALDYDREVFIVPGQIFDKNYFGCNEAISGGKGKSVSSAKEVLEELGMIASEKSQVSFKPEDESQGVIFEALTGMPQSVDDLMEKSALKSAIINSTLTVLELKGIVKNVGGGNWVKV
ncbi:TPA: DNA-protecting protein DprA [Candidatus Peribacteria bacterium]|nr:DNA-protecting protein DprA [Candidatus Peribacteria bacterium]